MARGLAATRGHAGSTAAARLGWSGARSRRAVWRDRGARKRGVQAATAAACGGGGLRIRRRPFIEPGSGLRRPSSLPHVLQACFRGGKALLRRRVQRRATRQRLIDRAVQERCPAWDWRWLTILDTTRGSDLEPRLVWELLVWRARCTHVRLPDPSRERYRARARRRETNLLTVC